MSSRDRAVKRAKAHANRLERKHDRLAGALDYDMVVSVQSLFDAANICKHGVMWKSTVAGFHAGLLLNCLGLHESIVDGSYHKRPSCHFILNERGKQRHISAVDYRDRIIQRSLCDNSLVPIVGNALIFDNAASLRGKGTAFARRRFRKHLLTAFNGYVRNVNNEYRHAGVRKRRRMDGDADVKGLLYHNNRRLRDMNDASIAYNRWRHPYAVVFDYRDYFGSIDSHHAFAMLVSHYRSLCLTEAEHASVERMLALLRVFIEDESHLGLGNQTSQTMAIWFVNRIDHLAEQRYGLYCRYMDDGVCVCPDRKTAEAFLGMLRGESARLGLRLNPSKTMMVDLTRPHRSHVRMLKRDYAFDAAGGLVVRMASHSLTMNKHHVKHVAMRSDGVNVDMRALLSIALGMKANMRGLTDGKGFWRSYSKWFENMMREHGFNVDMSADAWDDARVAGEAIPS